VSDQLKFVLDTDLKVIVWGNKGPPVLLLHGSTSTDGSNVWADQRPLSDSFRLLVVDRRGYGASPGPASPDWEDHIADVRLLLGEGAHLVGHSYGAVLGLVVGSAYPELIRSLTLIEPPAFGVAWGVPAVDELVSKLKPVFSPPTSLILEELGAGFVEVLTGQRPPPIQMTAQQREQTLNIAREPLPWDAPIDLDLLAAARFPKLVVSGDWHPAFEAVCDVLTARLDAGRLVLPGSGHGPHHVDDGLPLNARLRELFNSVEEPSD
jgi:pimeloyl-ACP methyl ester carboxylesterase